MGHERLGRTGLKISRLCLDTARFGSRSDEQASRAMLDTAVKQRLGGVTQRFREVMRTMR